MSHTQDTYAALREAQRHWSMICRHDSPEARKQAVMTCGGHLKDALSALRKLYQQLDDETNPEQDHDPLKVF